jgi:hypothetical protein
MAHGGDPLASSYSVESARDLIAVVTSLRSELIERPEEWENATLEHFLDAMAAWLSHACTSSRARAADRSLAEQTRDRAICTSCSEEPVGRPKASYRR